MRHMVNVVAMVVLSVTCASAADWPWAYGPRRDNTSDEKGLLRSWPQAGPEVLWTVPVGAGFGGPAVSDGKVYLLDRDEKVGDKLRVFDLSSGKELWSFAYEAPGGFMFAGSRTTPTVDADRVYTSGPTRRPVLHQHEDAEAGLAQEHLEGLRRRRAAPMGRRPASADLRRPPDRGAADLRDRGRRLRQADG